MWGRGESASAGFSFRPISSELPSTAVHAAAMSLLRTVVHQRRRGHPVPDSHAHRDDMSTTIHTITQRAIRMAAPGEQPNHYTPASTCFPRHGPMRHVVLTVLSCPDCMRPATRLWPQSHACSRCGPNTSSGRVIDHAMQAHEHDRHHWYRYSWPSPHVHSLRWVRACATQRWPWWREQPCVRDGLHRYRSMRRPSSSRHVAMC